MNKLKSALLAVGIVAIMAPTLTNTFMDLLGSIDNFRSAVIKARSASAAATTEPQTTTEWWGITKENQECILNDRSPAWLYETGQSLGYNPHIIDKGDYVTIESATAKGGTESISLYKGRAACEAQREKEKRFLDKYR
jgi:hypothetical protein